MELKLSEIKSITSGAVRIIQEEKGIGFSRFTEEQQEICNKTDAIAASSATGVKMRFKTNSEKLFLNVEVMPGSTRKIFAFDIFVNGELVDTIQNFDEKDWPQDYPLYKCPLGEFTKTILLGSGTKEVKIVFPWSTSVILKKMEIDDNSFIEPVKYKKKMIFYGDSITHGYDALHPSNKYTAKIAEFLDAEEYNKGIAGEVFCPDLALEKDDFLPDYIIVAYGTNDWGSFDQEYFNVKCSEFYKNIHESYPNVKIYAIAPIWRKDLEEEKKFGNFRDVSKLIENAVKNYENIAFIDAFDFVEKSEIYFSDLRLHPNDKGFGQYFENLKNYII